jgi:hypothetical protein
MSEIQDLSLSTFVNFSIWTMGIDILLIHWRYSKTGSWNSMKMTFQEIRIIATGPCITNQRAFKQWWSTIAPNQQNKQSHFTSTHWIWKYCNHKKCISKCWKYVREPMLCRVLIVSLYMYCRWRFNYQAGRIGIPFEPVLLYRQCINNISIPIVHIEKLTKVERERSWISLIRLMV